jgi:hypothetical protein
VRTDFFVCVLHAKLDHSLRYVCTFTGYKSAKRCSGVHQVVEQHIFQTKNMVLAWFVEDVTAEDKRRLPEELCWRFRKKRVQFLAAHYIYYSD